MTVPTDRKILHFKQRFWSIDVRKFYYVSCWFWGILSFIILTNYLGHPDNYIPADSIHTPAHVVPEWYFLPFYTILRG